MLNYAYFSSTYSYHYQLKIRRKQFHGGSIPPPGTIYPYYFQRLTDGNAERLAQFRYKIEYSAHPAYFQQVDSLSYSVLGRDLSIVMLAYAQLRSARRIKCPREGHFSTHRNSRSVDYGLWREGKCCAWMQQLSQGSLVCMDKSLG
jgi:hypothetical protein